MKTGIRLAMGAAALAIILQASSAMAEASPVWCLNSPNKGPRHAVVCPENGFGSRTSVTLPADRPTPSGKNTGIAIGNRTLPTIPTQNYFRPR
jgi:hypothetical protein